MAQMQTRRDTGGNEPGEAKHTERRDQPRLTPLVQPAKLLTGHGEYFCVVRNASESGMMIRHFGHLPPEKNLLIQLTNGERIPVSLVWNDKTQAGVQFESSVDIARIVSLTHGEHPRRPLRMNTSFMARLGWQEEDVPVEVINLSVQGARVKCRHPYALDQLLRLTTAFLRPLYAKVRWHRHHQIGLVFETTLGFEELARALADINASNVAAQSTSSRR